MRLIFIIALAAFWIVLAGIEFQRGDAKKAGMFLLVGALLTGYRLMRFRG